MHWTLIARIRLWANTVPLTLITDLLDGTVRTLIGSDISIQSLQSSSVQSVRLHPPKPLRITYVKAPAKFNYLLLPRLAEPVEFFASVPVYLVWLPSSSCDEELLYQRNQWVVKRL